MAKSRGLQKFFKVLTWVGGCAGLLRILLSEADIWIIVCTCICLLSMFLDIIVVSKREVILYLFRKNLNKLYEYLRSIHKIRYRYYFFEKTEKIEEITKELENSYKQSKQTAEAIFEYYELSDKRKDKIQEVVDKMKKLTETIQP